MFRLLGLVILGMSLVVTTATTQDKKEKDQPKVKGQLPAGFKDLGLTKAQIESIYKIQTEYKTKINELQTKINELKKTENKEVFGVLTDDQRALYLKNKGIEAKDKAKEKDKDKAKDK
jgi:hypothetical protein